MDFKFLLMVWGVAIVLVVLLGRPVMAVFGMFVAWLGGTAGKAIPARWWA